MMSYAAYEKAVVQTLWTWADQHHPGELDGGKRQGRPPVLADKFTTKNVLVPPNDASKSKALRSAIPQQHNKFCSLKSSQALTQSMFGAIYAFDRLDLLQNVPAECGRPAFFDDYRGWTLDFEHKVRCLKEPSPTSIDVLLSRPNGHGRVAVECKFTEPKFSNCSRTNPKRYPDPNKYCDGSYRVQGGRVNRCALTEIGVRYWDHLPSLFNWPGNRDHNPCLFRDVYQLARNALAAALTPMGQLDSTGGHALVVYDARNPNFQAGGKAEEQWDLAVKACRVPGLLRRLSWQRLLAAIAPSSELAYLVDGVREKYGLEP